MSHRIHLPAGCDYFRPNGVCYSQHEEAMSSLLGAGFGLVIGLVFAVLLVRSVGLTWRQMFWFLERRR